MGDSNRSKSSKQSAVTAILESNTNVRDRLLEELKTIRSEMATLHRDVNKLRDEMSCHIAEVPLSQRIKVKIRRAVRGHIAQHGFVNSSVQTAERSLKPVLEEIGVAGDHKALKYAAKAAQSQLQHAHRDLTSVPDVQQRSVKLARQNGWSEPGPNVEMRFADQLMKTIVKDTRRLPLSRPFCEYADVSDLAFKEFALTRPQYFRQQATQSPGTPFRGPTFSRIEKVCLACRCHDQTPPGLCQTTKSTLKDRRP